MAFWPKSLVRWLSERFPSAERLLGMELQSTESGTAGIIAATSVPALLYVDQQLSRRVQSLGYFLSRGFRCVAANDPEEAHVVCSATQPDAVVVMATELEDSQIADFHEKHCARAGHQPLVIVLDDQQSTRLHDDIATPGSHVLSGRVSLGSLRRELQHILNLGNDEELGLPHTGNSARPADSST